MRIVCLLMLFVLNFNELHSQRVDFQQFKVQYEEQKELSSANDHFVFQYFKEKTASDRFVSDKDLYQSLQFLANEASFDNPEKYFDILVAIGTRLQDAGEYEEAYYFIYNANEQSKRLKAIQNDSWKTYYIQTAFSRYYFRRFNESRIFLLKAYQFKNLTVYDSLQINNTLGLICRDQKNTTCSYNYFKLTLDIATRHKDKAWIAISSGNLAEYYFTIKDYQRARSFSIVDYETSKKNKDYISAILVLSLIIQIDVAMNHLEQASVELKELEKLLNFHNTTTTRLEVLFAKEKYLEAIGDFKTLHYTHKALVSTQDTLASRRDRENNLRTEFQIRFENEQTKLKLSEERKIRSEQKLLGLFVISLISAIAFIAIVYQINRRRKTEKAILHHEKEQLNIELKRTETEMLNIIKRLMEKNEIIDILENELNAAQENSLVKEEEKSDLKSKLQSFILLTDDDWTTFKLLFEKLNPDFYQKIMLHLPDLTNAEIRMICLLKLNLSVNEMSRTLAISVESVRKSSLRLRKKLDISDHDSLVKFILAL